MEKKTYHFCNMDSSLVAVEASKFILEENEDSEQEEFLLNYRNCQKCKDIIDSDELNEISISEENTYFHDAMKEFFSCSSKV